MTRITKLTMSGFKSFAKHTELIFEDRFNCVVGPNGSGKSNIVDAICFVLGRSSAKSLRAEKSGDLVYHGGKDKKPAAKAEVSIYFDNSDKTFPSEEKEIKITRILKPSGQSTYRINDRNRTRQQVVDLMAISKIDPDGYNIILQRDIESFVEMSPESRRQIVEEVAGISIYEDKKQKALNELDKVEAHIRDAEIIIAERETYMHSLKSERDQAAKYKEAKGKIDQNRATYLNIQITEREKEKGKIGKKNLDYQKEIEKIKEEIEKIKAKIEESRKSVQEITEEIEEKGEKERMLALKETENLKIELAKSQEKINSIKNEIKKGSDMREELSKSREELKEKIKRIETDISAMQKESKAKEKDLSKIEASIELFKKKNNLDNVTEIEKEIEKIDAETDEKQKEIQTLREEQQGLIRKKDQLDFKITEIEKAIDKVISIEKDNKEDIEKLKGERQEFKKIVLEINKLLSDSSSIASQLGTGRQRLEKSQEDLSRARVANAGIQEKIGSSIAVKRILEQKNKIRGIYGAVMELGTVTQKYALALEIAAGEKIKGIVVEDDAVAAECIKYLKANRFGVATFLPLNKIRGHELKDDASKLLGMDGVHGLAHNLISFDNKFKNVFQYVFGNTLVIDNIDTARRIGIGKARMVTLDGDLTETSGAMHGGFRDKKDRGGFVNAELLKNTLNLEKNVSELTQVVMLLEKHRDENEKTLEEMRKQKAELEGEILKKEKTLHLESGDIEVSKKEKQLIRDEIKKVEKQILEIDEKISDLNLIFAKIKTKKQELRGKIMELRNPSLIAELNTFEQKKQELKNSLLQLELDVKNNSAKLAEIHKPELSKIEKIEIEIEKSNNEFELNGKELEKRIKELEKLIAEKEKQQQEFYTKYKKLFEKRNELNALINQDGAQITIRENDVRNIEIKMNNLSLKNAGIEAELAGLMQQFEQYKDIQLLKGKTETELKTEIDRFERMVMEMGNVNLKALEIFDMVEKEYHSFLEKKEKLKTEKGDVLLMMNEIETKKKELFMRTFTQMMNKFKEIFSQISTKGEAYLKLENEENPFEGGVRMMVKISTQKFMDMRSLSGGEMALTALAFIFAIQEFEPATFYILDEVDASLDKQNSEKITEFITRYAKKAQYIVITHNDAVASGADTMYGIAMDEHMISKVYSMKV